MGISFEFKNIEALNIKTVHLLLISENNNTELTGTKGAASWGLLTPLVNAVDKIGTPFVQSTGVYKYGNVGNTNLDLDAPDIKSDKNAFIEKFK